MKIGDKVKVIRKPTLNEPDYDVWKFLMDNYIGFNGAIVGFLSGCVDVKHEDGLAWFYPKYCLSLITENCSCKIEILMSRGCKCGWFKNEIKS